ncbi:MAG: AbrB/MazE/SpoVT family DNA-binding domain-containing protein [Candidatus Methanoperedens sp.]
METITMSAKGQIVIPANIRKKYRLEKGEKLVIIEEDGYLKILPPTDLRTLCGSWSDLDLDSKAVRKQIEDMRKEDRY